MAKKIKENAKNKVYKNNHDRVNIIYNDDDNNPTIFKKIKKENSY